MTDTSNLNLNMSFDGMMPATGGGGQFPANDDAVPFHVCSIVDAERKMNSKSTGEILVLTLEGKSKEVKGFRHKWTINLAHTDPEVARRGQRELFAVVYATLGRNHIQNFAETFRKDFGVVIRPDPSNKEGENYTRVDHVLFADGRELVVNGVLQPFTVAPAGNFQQPGQQPGTGFQQPQQPAQQPFQSGAAVQQQAPFQPQQQAPNQPVTMPHPGAQQPPQQPFQQPAGGTPPWNN